MKYITLALAILSLSGCSLDDIWESPEKVCAAPETKDAITEFYNRFLRAQDNRYQNSFIYALDDIVFVSKERDTKLITCSGDLSVNGESYNIEFTRQPSAVGDSYIYKVTRGFDESTDYLEDVIRTEEYLKFKKKKLVNRAETDTEMRRHWQLINPDAAHEQAIANGWVPVKTNSTEAPEEWPNMDKVDKYVFAVYENKRAYRLIGTNNGFFWIETELKK